MQLRYPRPGFANDPHINALALLQNIPLSELDHNFETTTLKLVKRFCRQGQFRIGMHVTLLSDYYVALREACVDRRAAELAARLLAAFIRSEIRSGIGDASRDPVQIDAVIGSRDGSPLIAVTLSEILSVPCGVYGEKVYVAGQAQQEAWRLEGPRLPDRGFAVLVDDSTTDGHMLISMAHAARSLGLDVKHAFVVFNRNEGSAVGALRMADVSLHSIVSVDSRELRALMGTAEDRS